MPKVMGADLDNVKGANRLGVKNLLVGEKEILNVPSGEEVAFDYVVIDGRMRVVGIMDVFDALDVRGRLDVLGRVDVGV